MLPDLNVDIDAELVKYKSYAEQVRPFVIETISYIHGAIQANKSVLIEGANAAMLDIDFGIKRFLQHTKLVLSVIAFFLRYIPICHVIELQYRGCVYWTRYPTILNR